MSIESAFNSGVSGLVNANERISQSANALAQQPITTTNSVNAINTEDANVAPQVTAVTDSLINLRLAEIDAQTSVKVIETADNILGSLIDTRV